MNRLQKTLVGATALAVSAGFMIAGGVAASAATPPYEPDPNSAGTIAFYNASGVQITGGNLSDSPVAAYSVGSAMPAGSGTQVQADLEFCTPVAGVLSANWSCDQASAFTKFTPVATFLNTAPANIQAAATAGKPVQSGASGDESIQGIVTDFPNPASSGSYQNLYQIRLITANASGSQSTTYDTADVLVSGSTYSIVYGTPAATTTNLVDTPNPSNSGQTVTFTATESPAVAGNVQFVVNGTNFGSPVAVNGSGVATTTDSFTNTGTSPITENIQAVFTPTNASGYPYTGSTGTATQTVKPPATNTTTTVATGGTPTTAGAAASLTATVTPAGPGGAVGSVDFKDGTTDLGTVSIAGTSSPNSGTLNLPSGFAAGPHNITATFTPTDPTAFNGSSGTASFTTAAPLTGACASETTAPNCTDVQNIQAEIPVGTLTITTPYTAASPLDLGNLVLQPNATEYLGTAQFGGGSVAPIIITDTRAGSLPWTVNALASPLSINPGQALLTNTAGNTISAENVGFTGGTPFTTDTTRTPSTVSGGYNGFAGTVAFTPISADGTPTGAKTSPVLSTDTGSDALAGGTADPKGPAIASTGATAGIGTYEFTGTLTITAPVSTNPGTFTGTITFTVG